MITGIAAVWDKISADGRTELGWHARRIHAFSATPIHAALRQPGTVKALLLEVKARSIHPASTFPSSSGFNVTIAPLTPGPHGTVRVCLELVDNRYVDVFAILADDVATAVAAASSEVGGISALIGRLNTWQRFLKRHGDRTLTEYERIGLFGELLVLRDLLAKGLAASDCVDAWRGPWGGAQDFCLATCAVEVKATAAAHPISFDVANLAQLDDRSLPALILRHVTLLRAPDSGETLPSLVDSLQQTIEATDPAAAQRFSDSLLEVGYLDAQRGDYENEAYSVHAQHNFEVRGDFPRILSSDLHAGIAACSYSVELAACLPFLIDETRADRALHGDAS